MSTTSEQDTEITLGTGRMLALFFGLVLVCAFFFAIGFSFGRKTMVAGAPSSTVAVTSGTAATTVRPSAAKNTQPVAPSQDLTFFKSVEQKSADTSLTPPAPSQSASPPAAEAPKTDTGTASPAAATTAPAASTGGYYVQVAAVSRQEDADALVEALKKKQYPAFSTSAASDKFIHVQVGPYADLKDAEAMRGRLISDGYNPIVKK